MILVSACKSSSDSLATTVGQGGFLRYGADAYVSKRDLDPPRLREAIRVALTLPHKLVPQILKERNRRV